MKLMYVKKKLILLIIKSCGDLITSSNGWGLSALFGMVPDNG